MANNTWKNCFPPMECKYRHITCWWKELVHYSRRRRINASSFQARLTTAIQLIWTIPLVCQYMGFLGWIYSILDHRSIQGQLPSTEGFCIYYSLCLYLRHRELESRHVLPKLLCLS